MLLLTVLTGCQGPAEQQAEQAEQVPALSQHQAIRLAQARLERENVPGLHEYEVGTRVADGAWEVHFRRDEVDLLGWPSRFHVRVTDDGRTQIIRSGYRITDG